MYIADQISFMEYFAEHIFIQNQEFPEGRVINR